PGTGAGAEPRELRPLRAPARCRCDVGCAPRAGRPGPRCRHSPLSSSDGRDTGGDHRLPRRPRRSDEPQGVRMTDGTIGQDRTASLSRTTSESSVRVAVNLDGNGKGSVSTGVRFYDHMLLSLAKHSLIDLEIEAT